MKHQLPTGFMAGLVLAILISGCTLPVNLAPSTPGALTVQAGSLGSRTILPSLGTVTYDLAMAGPSGQNYQELGDSDGLFSLKNLPLGTWTATIEVRSAGEVVATGSVSRVLDGSPGPTLVVPMAWVFSGETTAPVFSVDASASPYPVLAATAYWDGVKTSDALNVDDKRMTLNFGAQTQGVHRLRIVFYRDLQKTLPVGTFDQGVVYLKLAGVPDIVLAANDFTAPGKPEMVEVPGGTFTFGTAQATVSPFLIGKYPVTQAQFQLIMGFNPSDYNNIGQGNPEATWSPVESVSWYDAVEFCNRLSLAEGLQPVYLLTGITRSGNHISSASVTTDLSRNGYRLPTEVEYEYATRAGTTTDYFWGGADGSLYSWGTYNVGSPLVRTYGVGQKLPNAWGLYDMVGNVWSWLNDYSAAQPAVATSDYAGPLTGTERLFKGGGFLSSSATVPNLDTAFLSGYHGLDDLPGTTMSDVGFRVVRRNTSWSVSTSSPNGLLSGGLTANFLDQGIGRFTHVQPDLQYPGRFLISGVSGRLDNTGISPWGTNLMTRFNADATVDPSFGNNTDAALNTARLPYDPVAMFSPFPQTHVIQTQYGFNGTTGESYFSGFAQNAFGLYVFQPSVAGGWNHTEVYRHDANGTLDVTYSQPVYTPGTEFFLPFVVYGQFRTTAPPAVDPAGALYSAGIDTLTGTMAVVKMASNGAFPWQNDTANYQSRFFGSSYAIIDFLPVQSELQPDQKLLVIGNDTNGGNGKLLRIDVSGASGTLDTGFGTGGVVTVGRIHSDGSQRHYTDVAYRDGKIYLLGWDSAGQGGAVQGFLLRLNVDGTLDPSFVPVGNNGAFFYPFHQPVKFAFLSNRVVVVGTTADSPGRAFVQILSLGGMAEGSPMVLGDPTLGSGALDVAVDSIDQVGVVGYNNKANATQPYHTLPAFWTF